MSDIPRTKSGLTLIEAELRIESLETAAAKAILVLAKVLKHERIVREHGDALISCVDLLFDELKLEGMKHCEYVNGSLERTRRAVETLRRTHAKRKGTSPNQ